MRIKVCLMILLAALAAMSAAAQPCPPAGCHDCGGYTDEQNHQAETYQGTMAPDSCIATSLSDPSIECSHAWGVNVWVSLNLNSANNYGISNCAANEIACGQIWCAAVGGGWSLHGFGVGPSDCDESDAQLHATSNGIACFRDGNGDDRYTPNSSDTLYNYWGCTK